MQIIIAIINKVNKHQGLYTTRLSTTGCLPGERARGTGGQTCSSTMYSFRNSREGGINLGGWEIPMPPLPILKIFVLTWSIYASSRYNRCISARDQTLK
jgi:hypothetical protein